MAKFLIVSGPVIIRKGQVLLDISSGDAFWKFCGGQSREEETLRETAIRRAKEELGIDIKITDPEPYIIYIPKPGAEKTDVLLVHWLADFNGDISPGPDVEKWEWFEISALPENIAPNIKPTLKHFNSLD